MNKKNFRNRVPVRKAGRKPSARSVEKIPYRIVVGFPPEKTNIRVSFSERVEGKAIAERALRDSGLDKLLTSAERRYLISAVTRWKASHAHFFQVRAMVNKKYGLRPWPSRISRELWFSKLLFQAMTRVFEKMDVKYKSVFLKVLFRITGIRTDLHKDIT